MTLTEFKAAVNAARQRRNSGAEIQDLSIFDGFGLQDFSPVTVTIDQLADLIRWQAGYLWHSSDSPEWNNEALEEIRLVGRRKFLVV